MRILIVEDEPTLGKQLKSTLEQTGYAVDLSTDGEDGHFLGATEEYDAVILDLGLPMMDGLTVLKHLRAAKPQLPVVVLTAMDDLDSRVAVLNAGADDYMTKPFDFPELEARLRALLRRATPGPDEVLRFADVELSPSRREVTRGGEPIELNGRILGYRESRIAQVTVTEVQDLLAYGRVSDNRAVLEKNQRIIARKE